MEKQSTLREKEVCATELYNPTDATDSVDRYS